MSDNAKLRELRDFVMTRTVEADEGITYARGAADIVMQVAGEIDRMLAEPEQCGFQVIEYEGRVARCDRPYSHCGAHSAMWPPQTMRVECAQPRESSAEECARLFGLVGPDGKGRP